MSDIEPPDNVTLSLDDVCLLAIECWRLRRLTERLTDPEAKSTVKHAVRRIANTLGKHGIETLDFVGRKYDAGMVPEVLDVQRYEGMANSNDVILETVTPTVVLRGRVAYSGQIIVGCDTSQLPESETDR